MNTTSDANMKSKVLIILTRNISYSTLYSFQIFLSIITTFWKKKKRNRNLILNFVINEYKFENNSQL